MIFFYNEQPNTTEMFIKPPFLTRHEYFRVAKAWNSVKEINRKAFKKQQNDNIQNFITANWVDLWVVENDLPCSTGHPIRLAIYHKNRMIDMYCERAITSCLGILLTGLPYQPRIALRFACTDILLPLLNEGRRTVSSAWMQWSRFLDCWRPKQVIYSSCHILLFSRLCMATELLCYVGSLHSIENWA